MTIVEQLQKIGAQSILRGFEVLDAGSAFHVWCKHCDTGWSLKKDSSRPGNVLHLLNHEASHVKMRGKK